MFIFHLKFIKLNIWTRKTKSVSDYKITSTVIWAKGWLISTARKSRGEISRGRQMSISRWCGVDVGFVLGHMLRFLLSWPSSYGKLVHTLRGKRDRVTNPFLFPTIFPYSMSRRFLSRLLINFWFDPQPQLLLSTFFNISNKI